MGTRATSAASRFTGLENSRSSSAGIHLHAAEPFTLQLWQCTRAVRECVCENVLLHVCTCMCAKIFFCLFVYFKVRASPPSHLSRGWRRNKLCLKWEAPLPILFAHLQYEVCYQIRGTDAWTVRAPSWTAGHFIFLFFPWIIHSMHGCHSRLHR